MRLHRFLFLFSCDFVSIKMSGSTSFPINEFVFEKAEVKDRLHLHTDCLRFHCRHARLLKFSAHVFLQKGLDDSGFACRLASHNWLTRPSTNLDVCWTWA